MQATAAGRTLPEDATVCDQETQRYTSVGTVRNLNMKTAFLSALRSLFLILVAIVYLLKMNSSSDEEEVLALLTLMRKGRKRTWIHDINKKREQLGEYHRLCRELESFEDRFFIYFRMSHECFETLHNLLEPKIAKFTTNWRRPIPARERLAICCTTIY